MQAMAGRIPGNRVPFLAIAATLQGDINGAGRRGFANMNRERETLWMAGVQAVDKPNRLEAAKTCPQVTQ